MAWEGADLGWKCCKGKKESGSEDGWRGRQFCWESTRYLRVRILQRWQTDSPLTYGFFFFFFLMLDKGNNDHGCQLVLDFKVNPTTFVHSCSAQMSTTCCVECLWITRQLVLAVACRFYCLERILFTKFVNVIAPNFGCSSFFNSSRIACLLSLS